MTLTSDALDEIRAERRRQDQKWGTQRHGLTVWQTVLTEEVGEVSQLILALRSEKQPQKRANIVNALQHEICQVAAVATAMLEHAIEENSQDDPFPDEQWEA